MIESPSSSKSKWYSAIFARRGAADLAALALFTIFTLAVFGRPVLTDPTGTCLCAPYSSDPSIYMWAMEWWPHALTHGLNPIITHVIWAPSGVNLAWATSVPSAALLGFPILATAGPVAAYNLLMLSAPVLAAYGAYRLCRHLTGLFWPSLAGAYVFGFSTYMLGHLLGHLNLVSVWPIPFEVLLVLLHLEGRISRRRFLLLGIPLALVQFGFSTELFVTTLGFGGLALLAGYVVGSAQTRAGIRTALISIVAAGAVLAVLVSPYLYFALADRPTHALGNRTATAVDVVNVVAPTSLTAIRLPSLADRITRNESEASGYLGLPLLAIVALFLIRERRTVQGRVIGATFILALLASFGPWLWFAGTRSPIPNPLGAYAYLPIVGNALPARFVLYAFLSAAVALALWLARGPRPSALGWLLAAAAIVALLPNPGQHWFNRDVPDPPFFRGSSAHGLRPNENVVVLPYGQRGFSMLWQATAHLRFRMAGGYVGPQIPAQFDQYPIVHWLETDRPPAYAEPLLRRFLLDKQVGAVIAGPGTAGVWQRLLLRLDPSPRRVGGVSIFDVS
jgi:hypothetical protein